MKRSRLISILLAIIFLTGCSWVQLNPSTNESDYEAIGRDTGTYLKVTKSAEWIEDSREWVDGALLLTDEEMLSGNILSKIYTELLKANPDNAGVVMLAKNMLTILGVKINLNVATALPEEIAIYVQCSRAVLKGYLEATK